MDMDATFLLTVGSFVLTVELIAYRYVWELSCLQLELLYLQLELSCLQLHFLLAVGICL